VAKSRQAPAAGRRRPDDDDDDPRRRRGRDDEDDDEDEGPIKPRKKKASAAGPVRKVMYIIGGVVLAIALIVLIAWIYSPVGTDSSMLCYFPPETTSLTGYDVEEVAKNTTMADVHTAIVGVYKRFGDDRWSGTGLTEKDVHRYLSGRVAPDQDEEKMDPQDRRGSITVVKFKQAVDRTKFIEGISGRFTVREMDSRDGGKKYHQLMQRVVVGAGAEAHEEQREDISFFFPDAKTLVYTTTRRETEEALRRVPGKVVVKDAMLDLSREVDGHFFRAHTGFMPINVPQPPPTGPGPPAGAGGGGAASPFGLGIVEEADRNTFTGSGIVGSADWFASNGNYFLYGELKLFTDARAARQSKAALEASFWKAKEQILQSEGGSASGLDDPFNPKPPAGQQQQPGFGGSAEDRKAILAALNEYVRYARVRQRGKAIIVEGQISHGTPEQGTFELFWKAIQNKVIPQQPYPGQFGPGGPGGMGGMPGPGR
jgi:hypothetical protein